MLKFFAEKMWVAFAVHIFSAKNIRILYTESAKTINEMTLNKLVNDALNNWAVIIRSQQEVAERPLRGYKYFGGDIT